MERHAASLTPLSKSRDVYQANCRNYLEELEKFRGPTPVYETKDVYNFISEWIAKAKDAAGQADTSNAQPTTQQQQHGADTSTRTDPIGQQIKVDNGIQLTQEERKSLLPQTAPSPDLAVLPPTTRQQHLNLLCKRLKRMNASKALESVGRLAIDKVPEMTQAMEQGVLTILLRKMQPLPTPPSPQEVET